MLTTLHRATYVRYAAASIVALGADLAVFFSLIAADVSPMLASGAGYITGIVVHWLISSRLVFASSTAAHGLARRKQKALFLGSALIGLGITIGIVGIGDLAGFDPRLAKLVAIAVSFQATYLMRKIIVFRP